MNKGQYRDCSGVFFFFLEVLGPIPGPLEARQGLYEQIVNAEQHSKSGEGAAVKPPH